MERMKHKHCASDLYLGDAVEIIELLQHGLQKTEGESLQRTRINTFDKLLRVLFLKRTELTEVGKVVDRNRRETIVLRTL